MKNIKLGLTNPSDRRTEFRVLEIGSVMIAFSYEIPIAVIAKGVCTCVQYVWGLGSPSNVATKRHMDDVAWLARDRKASFRPVTKKELQSVIEHELYETLAVEC